ncbi:uncharacterized protein [Periplaneta americana]|uniref:uncharacterized protein n=1 Tax=Periplaneta americana TaxID=6978 RepID=UPI0037E8226C
MEEIKKEPEVDPLTIQCSDNTDTDEKKPLSEEGNLLDLHVAGIKTECLDHSCDLTSDIKVEQTAVPTDSVTTKCKAKISDAAVMTSDDIPLITEEDLMTLNVELQTNTSIGISETGLPLTSSAEADSDPGAENQQDGISSVGLLLAGTHFTSLEKHDVSSSLHMDENDTDEFLPENVESSSDDESMNEVDDIDGGGGGDNNNEGDDYDGDSSTGGEVFDGYLGGKRKRKANVCKDIGKKYRNMNLRMKGEAYVGYKRLKTGKVKHDTPRDARKLGASCNSKMCQKSKFRQCNAIGNAERQEIFDTFWKKMTWDQRKQYVNGLVDVTPTKRPGKNTGESRRKGTLLYHFRVGNEKLQVCKKLFLNTLGIKDWSVRYWLENSKRGMSSCSTVFHTHAKKDKRKEGKQFLRTFFDSLPKLPSHYCRQSSSKLYLEPIVHSKIQLYDLYKQRCAHENTDPLSRDTFNLLFQESNISIYSSKKDQCDICCSYKTGNISEAAWLQHDEKKKEARKEKEKDKEDAQMELSNVFTMDLQAVKIVPYVQASSVYYKTKLCVHNFTIYNLKNHDVVCYWFDETQAELVASVFASCVIDALTDCIKENPLPVIMYSDGCTHQNRNAVMSNALLGLAISTGVLITQKYLEKGHTQMECDSVQSAIECKLRNRDITLPSQYVSITREARKKPTLYRVKHLEYSFFRNYADKRFWIYDSIRPGRGTNDPTVTDLRAIQYRPDGTIFFKFRFTEDWQEMPRRPRKQSTEVTYKQLYSQPLRIKKSKWNDLQQLKSVLPKDCHAFYDNIGYV